MRRRWGSLLCLLSVLCGCSAQLPAQTRPAVHAQHGTVVTAEETATRIGVEILKKGGNAVDAAVAVGFALAVTYPTAGNVGGGGFMLIRMHDGNAVVVDYRETAPLKATRDMYLDKSGQVVPERSLRGYLASGTPGTVAGLCLALEKYGTMKLRDVMQPAIDLARKGFPVSYYFAESLQKAAANLRQNPEAARLFLRNGASYKEGDLFVQTDLAHSLEQIARQGPNAFYRGKIAAAIAADMARHGGLISKKDLAGYRPVIRSPLLGSYRGYQIVAVPPPSSGGVALIEMLNMLETYPLAEFGPGSSKTYHVLAEVMRRAYADRERFLGDPDFVQVPVAQLTDKSYAQRRAADIKLDRASRSDLIAVGPALPVESPETTHFSVVDKDGNAVSNTYTLNGDYGSGVVVRGTGFLLNNEMDDFTSKAGPASARGEANAIVPRKRPRSSMTPTIAVRNGKTVLVAGSPGGSTIINTVLQILVNVLDFRMNLEEAVAAPRIHHQWQPDGIEYETYGIPSDVLDALKRANHTLRPTRSLGNAECILADPSGEGWWGSADHRGTGNAAGY